MEEAQENVGAMQSEHLKESCWPPGFMEKLHAISLTSKVETSNDQTKMLSHEMEGLASWKASQILWATGELSEPIPDGFYCVILERRLKELFESIPSPDELYTLDLEGLKAEVVIVNTEQDKTLSMLKQLIVTLVKGLNSNPAAIIRKIAALVCDFYKWPNSDLSPSKAGVEEISYAADNQGILMLGQIRNGSCRARAILFKVLADTVGLDTKILVGLPRDGLIERAESYKHISVIAILNSMELLVDLMHFPGQLAPCLRKEIFMSHICSIGENEFAENDSCGSPLEPTSPLCGYSERLDTESIDHDESLHSSYRNKLEAYLALLPKASVNGKLTLDRPLFRGNLRSAASGDKVLLKEYSNAAVASRSVGYIRPDARRRRRRHSISMAPEIGDDVVRAVRALNETVKRDRVLKTQGDGQSCCSTSELENVIDHQVSNHHEELNRGNSTSFSPQRSRYCSQKAISLPTSPHKFRGPGGSSDYLRCATLLSTCKEVIESSKILDKVLLPYQEWNIDFSELTVGTRVGIGFFGEVFRGTWNGTDVAIKVFLEQDLTVENIEDFSNEISILSRVRHPNVILFLGACTKPPRLSMVTEFMDMGSLYFLIHVSGEKDKLSWRRRIKMLCDICRGLMCIHRMNIVHRDLKSANCLVNKHMSVKICDFGLSRVQTAMPMKDSSAAGTPEWMAPELIRNEPYTEKCDIFSLGVIIWELFTLKRPWEGLPGVQVVYAVAHEGLRLQIPEGPLGKIIADCWAEPKDRPGCEEILARLLKCENVHC